jgi:hypothetical protein
MGVNHLHLKLYPLHGIEKAEWEEISTPPEEHKFYETYEGYVCSMM